MLGTFLSEDQRSLDILAARPEVDADNLGCIGLSGGGLRTVMLTGMDSRIKAGVCAGMMTTWRDYLMHHSYIHTWMAFMPHMPRYMDYSEIFGLNLSACLVLNNTSDQIFDLDEMKKAEQILSEVYEKAGASDKFKTEFYPGNHKFDGDMQDSAYEWLLKWLADGKAIEPEPPKETGDLKLGDNYPNPFSSETTIPINIPVPMFINLTVYNLLGKEVKTLVNEEMETGEQEIRFNGSDLAAGVYFYRLRKHEGVKTKSMTMV